MSYQLCSKCGLTAFRSPSKPNWLNLGAIVTQCPILHESEHRLLLQFLCELIVAGLVIKRAKQSMGFAEKPARQFQCTHVRRLLAGEREQGVDLHDELDVIGEHGRGAGLERQADHLLVDARHVVAADSNRLAVDVQHEQWLVLFRVHDGQRELLLMEVLREEVSAASWRHTHVICQCVPCGHVPLFKVNGCARSKWRDSIFEDSGSEKYSASVKVNWGAEKS